MIGLSITCSRIPADVSCCGSCHDDEEHGYPGPLDGDDDLDLEGVTLYLCCSSLRWWDSLDVDVKKWLGFVAAIREAHL